MPLAEAAQRICLFRSLITNRRFDDETLQILESVLTAKDVKSLLEARSSLKEFMRSESLSVIHEIAEKTVEQKLLILEFFVRAFALLADIESCLALKYEGLLLREFKSTTCQWLQVSSMEWLNFAEQSLDNGFYSIARRASENALLCLQKNEVADAKTGDIFKNSQTIGKIKRIKDCAVKFAASGSVQAQAAEYMTKKTVATSKIRSLFCKEAQCVASTWFRKGIKRRHLRKLQECQRMPHKIEH